MAGANNERAIRHLRRIVFLKAVFIAWLLSVCSSAAEPLYRDTSDLLGDRDPRNFTMDIAQGDVNGDGHLDLVFAIEFRPNVLLLGTPNGSFESAVQTWAPIESFDSEDALLGDVDNDGDLDLIVLFEDNRTDSYLLNRGDGTFTHNRLPVDQVSNSGILADIDDDGDLNLVIGNNGSNSLLRNDGTGAFAMDAEFPSGSDVTQDLGFGDVNDDGLADIIVANEGVNRLLLAAGNGRFVDATVGRFPKYNPGETRDVSLSDIDGDGDLYLYLSNVRLFEQLDPQDRLLINDGSGHFRDETDLRLLDDEASTMDAAFADLDGDGDLDIVLAQFRDLSGKTWTTPVRALMNDGTGRFFDGTAQAFPGSAVANGMHVEVLELGIDQPALMIGSRGGPDLFLLPNGSN